MSINNIRFGFVCWLELFVQNCTLFMYLFIIILGFRDTKHWAVYCSSWQH